METEAIIDQLNFYIKNEEKNILAYFSGFAPIFNPLHYYPLRISLCYQVTPAKEIFFCVMNDFSESSKILLPDVKITFKEKEINLTGEKLPDGFFEEKKNIEFFKFKISDGTAKDILSSEQIKFLFSFKYRKGINVLSQKIPSIGRKDFVKDISGSPKIDSYLDKKTADVMRNFRELYKTSEQELRNIKSSKIKVDFTNENKYKKKVKKRRMLHTVVPVLVVVVISLFCCIVSLPPFLCQQKREKLLGCSNNLRNLGVVVGSYAKDNDGHYPQNLDVLVELGYIEKLPVCPVKNKPYKYTISGWEDETFTIWCPNPKRHIGDSGPCSHTLLLYYEPNSKVNQVDENSK
ncbi:hypothetical protein KAU33_08355 [Candidatus Dependentiae bacterium]|nr:hypothetical protein [Candidatus Dependentiae bacterium]